MRRREFLTALRDEYRSTTVADHLGDLIGAACLLLLFFGSAVIAAVLS